MNTFIYFICQLIIPLIVFGLLSMLLYGLQYALTRMHVRRGKRELLLKYIAAGALLWLAILSVLSSLGFFRDFERAPFRIFLALIPPLLVVIWLLRSRFLTLVLKTIPESWLITVQAFRVLMELSLWLGWLGGFVPVQMTFKWLNHDIIVGLTAVVGGYVFFGRGYYRRPEAIIWNIFGIILLVNILIIGLLSTPSSFRVFMNEPANAFIAEVPFIWIPGFIVPFAIGMHLFSLKQLFSSGKVSSRLPGRQPFSLRK